MKIEIVDFLKENYEEIKGDRIRFIPNDKSVGYIDVMFDDEGSILIHGSKRLNIEMSASNQFHVGFKGE